MRSLKLFPLLFALLLTCSAIPVERGVHVARNGDEGVNARDFYDEYSIEARNDFNDLEARHLIDDYTLYPRDNEFDLDARELEFDSDLAARSDDFEVLEARGRSNKANDVIKAQGQKQQAAEKKANANKKTAEKATAKTNASIPKPKKPDTAGKSPEDAKKAQDAYKKADADRKKAADKAGSQAVTQAVKDKKAQRTQKWADAKGKPGPAPATNGTPRTKDEKKADRAATQAQKKATGAELKAAGQKMQSTKDIPGRKESYTVSNAKNPKDKGTKEISGKDVRKAVFNSNVNEKYPVGQPGKEQPKQFRNDPYSPTHPDPNLKGKPAIPGLPANKGVEYPVLSGSKSGWTGEQPAGTSRVITEKGAPGQPDKLQGVIAHDKTKGGSSDDHYLINKNPPKPAGKK